MALCTTTTQNFTYYTRILGSYTKAKAKAKSKKGTRARVHFLNFIFELLIRAAGSSPQEPGIGDVFDGSGDRAAFAGAEGRSRGA